MSNTPDPNHVANNTVDVFDSSGHLLAGFTGGQALQQAVNFANTGTNDIVSAGTGTYTGDLNVLATMTIESAHGAGTVTTIGTGTNPANDGAIRVNAGVNDVHIGADGHGLTVQTSATEQGSEYLAGNNSNTVIEGNNLTGDGSAVVVAQCGASFGDTRSASKKILRAAEQERADVARARRRWMREQGMFDPARLVFLDETATSTNMVRLRGRCSRGQRLIDHVPHSHWRRSPSLPVCAGAPWSRHWYLMDR